MGCGGSKKAAAAPAEAPVADYKISLERSTDADALGMTVVSDGNGAFKISALKEEGLVPTYNKAPETTPETQVKAGDLILAVNDVFGNLDEMKKQLQQKTVALSLKRQPAAEAAPAAAAEEAPASAPAESGEGVAATAGDAEQAPPAADGEPAADAAAATTEAAAEEKAAAPDAGEAAGATATDAAAAEAVASTEEAEGSAAPATTTPIQPVEQETVAAGAPPAGQDDSLVAVSEEPQEINAEQTERRVCC